MKNILAILIFFTFSFSWVTAQTTDCQCCTENHRAFDFWVGTWDVTDISGNIVGTNKIEKLQDGCVVRENWNGKSGSTGISINFFNSTTEQWEQLWVDNLGTHLKLRGNRDGNRMILSSDEYTQANGKTYKNRITWTKNDDGTVRQLWEILEKDTVVRIAFDGLYKKMQ